MIDPKALDAFFADAALRSPEDAVGFLLWRVAHRYQREIDRACAAVNLTHLQFVILVMSAWLGRSEETLNQTSLAAFSGIHPMQISAVLKTLEAKKLIARRRGKSDIRSKEIGVTAQGLSLLGEALPLAAAAQDRFFGPDKDAGEDLHRSLRQIVASWESGD